MNIFSVIYCKNISGIYHMVVDFSLRTIFCTVMITLLSRLICTKVFFTKSFSTKTLKLCSQKMFFIYVHGEWWSEAVNKFYYSSVSGNVNNTYSVYSSAGVEGDCLWDKWDYVHEAKENVEATLSTFLWHLCRKIWFSNSQTNSKLREKKKGSCMLWLRNKRGENFLHQ